MLASQAAQPEAAGTELRSTFERVLAEVEMLHAGALTFMRSLGDLMRSVEQVGEDEFQRGKGALLEHLQGFKKSRMQYSAEILGLLQEIERADPAALIARIVAAEEFVALPGGATLEEQRTRRTNELHQRWHGLTAWFVGDDATSPWRTLNDQVVEAIRAVLAIAERLIERRSTRVDRAGVFLHLAAQVAAAPPGDATAWLRAAFGIRTPRHIGVVEDPATATLEPGRTSWLNATPAPVVAHLRTPGKRQPGTGRGAQIADLTESHRQFQERRAAERRELETILTRFTASGPIRISALEHANAAEFRHLLHWLSRAYEAPAHPDGTRRAGSIDGRATIVLTPPPDPTTDRAKLKVPHGTLDLPDYRIEVIQR